MVLSDFTKGEIIGLYKEKNTQAYISNKLGVSQSTVSRTIKKYLETGNTDNKPCLGAKKSFDSSVVNIILQIANKNPKSSLRKIASEVETRTKKYISHVTVRKILNDNNLYAYSPIKKPLLSKKNILSRVEKTGKFICMSKDQVKTIIFSDESKFNLFYSDGKCSVWRPPSTGLQMKYLTPTVKFGGGQ